MEFSFASYSVQFYTVAIFLAILSALVVVSILWRGLSTQRSLPCPASLGWLLEMDNPLAKVSHAPSIIKDCGIVDGMAVLDAGCGPGRITLPVAEQVGPRGTVVALDIQAAMLGKVRAKAQRARLCNIEYLEAGLGGGMLKKAFFDRAIMVMVLGEIPEKDSALREIYSALKPGGLLAITETVFDPHFQRRASLRELAEATGFQVSRCHGGRLAYTMVLQKP